jgi:hypothetical protein
MPEDRRTRFRQRFRHQLSQLQVKIDSLPDELRSHFRTLLDEKEQECLRLQEKAQVACDIADDLTLAATHAAFHLEATWREVKECR